MKYVRGKHLAWRDLGTETVVIHLRTKRVYGLNATGGFVWGALAGEGRPDRIAHLIDRSVVVQDVEAFLSQLAAEDLVEAGSEAAGPETELGAFRGEPVPPQIAWRDEVTAFLGACGKLPGGGAACSIAPELS